jgi:hypothetical protein
LAKKAMRIIAEYLPKVIENPELMIVIDDSLPKN